VTVGRGAWKRCEGSGQAAVDLEYEDGAPAEGKCPRCSRPVRLRGRLLVWPHREMTLAERPLPDGLAGTSFERAGCRQVEGEPLLAARARGYAAECAAEALELLQAGEVTAGRDALRSALDYTDRQEKP
jgi:hypothetical protein